MHAILKTISIITIGFLILYNLTSLAQTNPEKILLKDFRPKSIYNIPITTIPKAKFPIIDVHSHAYANSVEDLDLWINNMNEAGVIKTILLTYAHGTEFD